MFKQFIAYKAEEAGKWWLETDPTLSNTRCGYCGTLKPEPEQSAVFSCSSCGMQLERSFNSALNIRALGISQIANVIAIMEKARSEPLNEKSSEKGLVSSSPSGIYF